MSWDAPSQNWPADAGPSTYLTPAPAAGLASLTPAPAPAAPNLFFGNNISKDLLHTGNSDQDQISNNMVYYNGKLVDASNLDPNGVYTTSTFTPQYDDGPGTPITQVTDVSEDQIKKQYKIPENALLTHVGGTAQDESGGYDPTLGAVNGFITDNSNNTYNKFDVQGNYIGTYAIEKNHGFLGNLISSTAPILDMVAAATGNPELIPLINGASTVAQGGNLGKALTNAALSYATAGAGDALGGVLSDAGITSPIAQSAITNAATQLATTGKIDPVSIATGAALGAGENAAFDAAGVTDPTVSGLLKNATNQLVNTGSINPISLVNSTISSGVKQNANNTSPTPTDMTGFQTDVNNPGVYGTGSTNQSPIDNALPVTGMVGGVDGTQLLNTTTGGLPSTTVASNDPLAGTGLTKDENGNLVFSNPGLTAAGQAGPMTAGLTNVPGSAPPMTNAELAAASRAGQVIDLGTVGNLDNTDSQSTSGIDTSTNDNTSSTDNTDTSGGDYGGVSGSLPTSSGSSGLSASDVQSIVAQQMAANPGLTEAQVKSDIQSALAADPGMTADQVNQIVGSNLAGVNNQVSGLQTGLDTLSGTVAGNQAQTESQLTGMSAQEKSDVQALQAQGVSLQDAINQVAQQNQSGLNALSNQFTDQLAQSDASTKAQFGELNQEQQEQAKALTAQGTSLQDAINQASQQSSQQIAAQGQQLGQGLAATNENLSNLTDQEKQDYQNLNVDQAGLAKQLTDTGMSLADSINQVKNLDEQGIATVQGQLNDYQQQTQAGLDTTNQNIENLSSQTQDEIAKSAEAAAAANAATNATIASNQASTSSALSGLGSGLTALQQAQQQAKAQAMMPKFNNDVSVLTSKNTPSKFQKEAALHQLYETLDPELAKAMGVERPAVSTSSEEDTQAAHGGSIHNFDSGGSSLLDETDNSPGQNLSGILNTLSTNLQPKFASTPSAVLQSTDKYAQQMKLHPMRQLYQSINPDLRAHLMGGGPVVGLGGMAEGGLPARYHPEAPEGHHPEFITGQTGYYAAGRGTGQSDDIPAMLNNGDYVLDADTVAQLGDGSSKAGAQALEHFRNQVPHHAHGGLTEPVPAKIADGEYVLPASFVTALGGGDNKTGSKLLDKMREELREHKRSAPINKIPPKAKSPLDYLRMAKHG